MLRDVIGEHQRVLAVLVLEPVVDAFVLHQAADEGEVGFLVLHAVFPVAVVVGQLDLDRKLVVGQHLLDHVRGRLVLEDLVVRRLRQVPEPRTQGRAVDIVAGGRALAPHQHAARDLPVQVARLRAGRLDLQRDGFPQQLLHVQRMRIRHQLHVELEKLRQRLVPVHPAELQLFLGQRGISLDYAFHIPFP
ncbi:hypothetical protein AD428_14600 [Achromobacter sp. DMS1]|nr:hypothetical protein AD428_14600 [Achromobacter sp. DMS1]